MKKIFLIIILSLVTFQYSHAAGSGGDGGEKQKTNEGECQAKKTTSQMHVAPQIAIHC